MKLSANQVETNLKQYADPKKAAFYPRFFKTGPGEYGEGDRFIGVIVPVQRKIAREFRDLPRAQLEKLLKRPYHECRLTALLILVLQFEAAQDKGERKRIYDFYLKHLDYVNNWDLVDASAHKIVGPYLFDKDRSPLIRLAKARHLWKNRTAIISTYYFIRNDDFESTLEIAALLLPHKHDLIHKAVGWMLREVGKRNESSMIEFLRTNYEATPRTTLRYAIEKLPKPKQKRLLAGDFE